MALHTFARLFWIGLLLVAILSLLGIQRCTQLVTERMSTVHPAPASHSASAVLSVAYVMPFSSRRWAPRPVADTGRVGGLDHLRRKATPRNRWLPAQPAYLRGLHRRPSQHVLDSAAAASMRS
jgi:hypothetical protein